MEMQQLNELLLQALEVERGGAKLYEAAVACAQNEELREEWEKYLGQTRRHVEILERAMRTMGLDLEEASPGRKVAARIGESLLEAIAAARREGTPAQAQIVAAECVVFAETKDHLDWELIGEAAGHLKGEQKKALADAYEEIEDEEDEHLYHTRGWCRELWMESLGLKAVLPPPEERKHVKTAIGAARAEQSRKRNESARKH
jgi:rubrerythrin